MDYIFVTGMSRSGTTLVARLLDSDPDVGAQHEHIGDRHYGRLVWYLGDDFATPYLERERSRIEREWETPAFADVSARLQRSARALEKVFAPRVIFHLVRDPRDVVRSIYTRRGPGRLPFVPSDAKEIRTWLEGDSFTHICMHWAEVTRELAAEGLPILQLERLTTDYAYFRDELLVPCGLEVPRAIWEANVGVKLNRTRSRLYRYAYSKLKRKGYVADPLPPYEAWSPQRKEEFLGICGEAMSLVGYDPDALTANVRSDGGRAPVRSAPG